METKIIRQGDQLIEHSVVDKRCIDPVKRYVQEAARDQKFAADNVHIARIPEFVVNEIHRKHGINLLTLSKGDTDGRARFIAILKSEYPHFLIRKNG